MPLISSVLASTGDLVFAQDLQNRASSENVCKFDKSIKGFEETWISPLDIRATFIENPGDGASVEELKNYFAHSLILGKIATTHIHQASLKKCYFQYRVDSILGVTLRHVGLNRKADVCSLNYCARFLTEWLQSANLDETMFSRAVNSVAQATRRSESPSKENALLSMKRAAREAYRTIYQPGTKEHVVLHLSADDYSRVQFEKFKTWFERQQAALINEADSIDPKREPSNQSSGNQCASEADVRARELNLDADGWGHKAIVLIKRGHRGSALHSMAHPLLDVLCSKSEQPQSASETADISARLICLRDDGRWLVLFPRQPSSDVREQSRQYAEMIANALQKEQCLDPELRIFVVNFLQK